MDQVLTQVGVPTDEHPIASQLRSSLAGDVHFDRLHRAIYATDASIYEMVPLGVVLPRHVKDVVQTIADCQEHSIPIVARGAGTGLAGGALGSGIQLDFSRYMNRMGKFDAEAKTIDVEPGVVLDELNDHLLAHGVHFAPDVATSSRATIGGMIANNSCGTHSVIYGRTVDHIEALTVVLADGQQVTFERTDNDTITSGASHNSCGSELARSLSDKLSVIRDEHYDEIVARFPKILRSNGGYGLDRLGPRGSTADPIKVLCGSEGTLGMIVSAKLRLTPMPTYKQLVVLQFRHLLDSLTIIPDLLTHHPAAIELIDKNILDAGKRNVIMAGRTDFLADDCEALLVVEFYGDAEEHVTDKAKQLLSASDMANLPCTNIHIVEPDRQRDVWDLRKAGLGLLMSKPGDAQPIAFVEDTAVPPEKLHEYISRFSALLGKDGVDAAYYAHASVGCLHVRPIINLKKAGDIERMHRIAEGVADLALEFEGTITGEHGDGLVRSCWLEKLYGPRIIKAFGQVKNLFDPTKLLNPNKIVDPLPMTEHLRFGASFSSTQNKTTLDFSEHGGMAGLTGMCSGVGQCRQRLVGTMCPSYMATNDEKHTTRARANALRVALSNRTLLTGLDDACLSEAMDLCLSCKACKTECPTGVDMARLKMEYLSQRILRNGASPRDRLIADTPHLAKLGSRFPRLANWLSQSSFARRLGESRFGFDQRIAPPQLTHQTFRSWFKKYNKQRQPSNHSEQKRVVYFVDTWTNYFAPQIGQAAVRLLERAGYQVLCPEMMCCGRPAMSRGLLAEAKELAENNILRLVRYARAGVPIVGTEPSCILALTDEYPQLVPTIAAKRVAKSAMMIETFLGRLLQSNPHALGEVSVDHAVLYHAHCHQKALIGADDAIGLLQQFFGDKASLINSGCCGMAGAFGHEVEHYEVAKAVGEQRLFPAIRSSSQTDVAVSGFSCRQQIEHHTDAKPKHVVELLAACIADS